MKLITYLACLQDDSGLFPRVEWVAAPGSCRRCKEEMEAVAACHHHPLFECLPRPSLEISWCKILTSGSVLTSGWLRKREQPWEEPVRRIGSTRCWMLHRQECLVQHLQHTSAESRAPSWPEDQRKCYWDKGHCYSRTFDGDKILTLVQDWTFGLDHLAMKPPNRNIKLFR